MARPLPSQDMVGSKGVVTKEELVRIIADALYYLGFSKSGASLEEESRIKSHHFAIDMFTKEILDGQWDASIATLRTLSFMSESAIKHTTSMILEQKFFELLDGEKVRDAVKTLRTEIVPLCIDNERVKWLSYILMSSSHNHLMGTSDKISKFESRKKLLEELIPENRLVHLLEQALCRQISTWKYHKSPVGKMSLLGDHPQRSTDQLPCQTLQVLDEHKDEVWFVQFSHNGQFLASGSRDCIAIIWEVKSDGQVCMKHRLWGHQTPVSYISWSPDDHQLLTCGVEETVLRWDTASGKCLHVYQKMGLGAVSCSWSADGKNIFSGFNNKSISKWDLEGNEVECWVGNITSRIADIGITSDGKKFITVCEERTIIFIGWEPEYEDSIEADQEIVSFSQSEDRKLLLVNLSNGEIHLWSIDGRFKWINEYTGHKRSRFVVRSCLGGVDEAFIASGSEDSQVYIWHQHFGDHITKLAGHSGAVNCVSWNPTNPHMLASASDDRSIRIWG